MYMYVLCIIYIYLYIYNIYLYQFFCSGFWRHAIVHAVLYCDFYSFLKSLLQNKVSYLVKYSLILVYAHQKSTANIFRIK